MHNVSSKKSKLNLQVRSLGAQPVVETDLQSIPDAELDTVSGGQAEELGMAFGRTRSCGVMENV